MNRLGIIGGLGPMATAYFMELVTKMTQADTDQEHIDMIIYSRPSIPDRTKYILGESKESPLPAMIEVGKTLVEQHATRIAIPCITAHYFHDELENAIRVPIIHGIAETVQYLSKRGYRSAGIMATDGTVRTGLFTEELRKKNMTAIYPDETGQAYVMDLIYRNVKAGKPVDMEKFQAVADELHRKGAEVILLGCTELSLIKRDYPLQAGFLDVMEVLAKCSVESCAVLKEEYKELITR
ncbi:aspartate racemase [Clostridium sp. CAG:510]|nr:aspartate racemase [Clostridium sp. CAG:510]